MGGRRAAPRAGRRLRGVVRHHLADLVYGANDGIITTFAVVAGVVGATLPTRIILILGFANLLADGVSMGASNYLSKRSTTEPDQHVTRTDALRHALATLVGFLTAGVAPLAAYLVPGLGDDRFPASAGLALLALFVVGASRSYFTRRGWLRSGMEMLLVGAAAAGVAYGMGVVGARITGQAGAPGAG